MTKYWCRSNSPEYDVQLKARLVRLSRAKPGGCCEWTGSTVNGYGRLRVRGRLVLAHRVVYELAHGTVPNGLDVLHKCDNPGCVEVTHLFVGDHRSNMEDKARKGRAPSKLHASDIPTIRAELKSGRSCNSIAVERGVSPHTIADIRDGVTWSHVTN